MLVDHEDATPHAVHGGSQLGLFLGQLGGPLLDPGIQLIVGFAELTFGLDAALLHLVVRIDDAAKLVAAFPRDRCPGLSVLHPFDRMIQEGERAADDETGRQCGDDDQGRNENQNDHRVGPKIMKDFRADIASVHGCNPAADRFRDPTGPIDQRAFGAEFRAFRFHADAADACYDLSALVMDDDAHHVRALAEFVEQRVDLVRVVLPQRFGDGRALQVHDPVEATGQILALAEVIHDGEDEKGDEHAQAYQRNIDRQ